MAIGFHPKSGTLWVKQQKTLVTVLAMNDMKEILKEAFGWLAVLVVFGLIILIVVTGDGILSPEFWALL